MRTLASVEHTKKPLLRGLCNYFDIVTAPYGDLEGNSSIGLFLIIYLESKDSAIPKAKNAIGLKITSKESYPSKYRVAIPRAQCPKLAQDSYVYVNHPYTLMVNKCVHVCTLPEDLYNQVSSKLLLYTANINNQLVGMLNNKLTLRD